MKKVKTTFRCDLPPPCTLYPSPKLELPQVRPRIKTRKCLQRLRLCQKLSRFRRQKLRKKSLQSKKRQKVTKDRMLLRRKHHRLVGRTRGFLAIECKAKKLKIHQVLKRVKIKIKSSNKQRWSRNNRVSRTLRTTETKFSWTLSISRNRIKKLRTQLRRDNQLEHLFSKRVQRRSQSYKTKTKTVIKLLRMTVQRSLRRSNYPKFNKTKLMTQHRILR